MSQQKVFFGTDKTSRLLGVDGTQSWCPPAERRFPALPEPYQWVTLARRIVSQGQVRNSGGRISQAGKGCWRVSEYPYSYVRILVLEIVDLFFLDQGEESAFQVSCGCLIYLWPLAGKIDMWNVLSFRSHQEEGRGRVLKIMEIGTNCPSEEGLVTCCFQEIPSLHCGHIGTEIFIVFLN